MTPTAILTTEPTEPERRSHDEPVRGKPGRREVNVIHDILPRVTPAEMLRDAPPKRLDGLDSVARVRFLHGEMTGTYNADKAIRIYLDAARQCIVFDRYSAPPESQHITRKRFPMASVAFYVLDGEPLGT